MHATNVGDVVGWASHKTVTSPACHRRQPLVAQRVTVMAVAMRDKAIQDIAALSKNLISVLGTLHGYHLWWMRTCKTSSRSTSDGSEALRHGTLLNYFGRFSAGPFIPGSAQGADLL